MPRDLCGTECRGHPVNYGVGVLAAGAVAPC